MKADRYTFAVTDILADNRVRVCIYVRIGQHIHLVVRVYNDVSMTAYETALDVNLVNGGRDEQ